MAGVRAGPRTPNLRSTITCRRTPLIRTRRRGRRQRGRQPGAAVRTARLCSPGVRGTGLPERVPGYVVRLTRQRSRTRWSRSSRDRLPSTLTPRPTAGTVWRSTSNGCPTRMTRPTSTRPTPASRVGTQSAFLATGPRRRRTRDGPRTLTGAGWWATPAISPAPCRGPPAAPPAHPWTPRSTVPWPATSSTGRPASGASATRRPASRVRTPSLSGSRARRTGW